MPVQLITDRLYSRKTVFGTYAMPSLFIKKADKRSIRKLFKKEDFRLRKITSILLSLALVVFSVPVTAHAAQSDLVIDKRGAKTYVGTAAAWGKTWDEDSFEEVTGKDVTRSDNLTVKNGDVKDITLNGSDSKLTVLNGTINSIETEGDITLTKGTVKRNVSSDAKITFNGDIKIGGTCFAQEIASSGSATATVTGTVIGYDKITLTGKAIKSNGFSGNNQGTLLVNSYTLPLPAITDMEAVTVDGINTAYGRIDAGTLTLNQKAELTANSTIEVDTLSGPGTLSYYAGKLTVNSYIQNKPLFYFLNPVGNGTVAFRSDSSSIDETDVRLFDYELDRDYSGGHYQFALKNSIREGITLEPSSVSVSSKNSALVKANVRPDFSKFAEGTKIVWELHGDTTAFSISPDTSRNSCRVTLNSGKPSSSKATLRAYLVDKNGERLSDYKSDSSVITVEGTTSPTDNSGLALDTSSVTIPVGDTYWVLAVTNSSTPPTQISYNSAVATVGAAKAYSDGGKTGWLYPVKGISRGGVTIDIGGQKMIAKIAGGSIVVDTASYTMAPGGKYMVGVKMHNVGKNDLNVYSENSCTSVQYAGKTPNGLDLFVVRGEAAGNGAVVFSLTGGQSVRTVINVQNGAAPGGVSGRLVAAVY
jgi:hypothetical protein